MKALIKLAVIAAVIWLFTLGLNSINLEAERQSATEETRRWRRAPARARARGFRGLETIVRGKPRTSAVELPPAGR